MKSVNVFCIAVFAWVGFALASCRSPSNAITTPETGEPQESADMYGSNIQGRPYTFSGKVTRGQIYEHEMVQDLVFCLMPLDSFHDNIGWLIVVSDRLHEGCSPESNDFVGIVSPPFHGINPIFIEGWHFRNEDNTGDNDGSVNAPQETRWFNFVLNQDDYQEVWKAHACLSWGRCDTVTSDEAMHIIADTPKTVGQLIITDLELGNLMPDEKAWIDAMEFEVRVDLP